MSMVTVKNKFQVVIPERVREQLGIGLGDVLEAKVERGKLIYIPKTVVVLDRSESRRPMMSTHPSSAAASTLG